MASSVHGHRRRSPEQAIQKKIDRKRRNPAVQARRNAALSPYRFAAVDLGQPVPVWGLGRTVREALQDSRNWRDDGSTTSDWLPLTEAARAYLAAGGEPERLVITDDRMAITVRGQRSVPTKKNPQVRKRSSFYADLGYLREPSYKCRYGEASMASDHRRRGRRNPDFDPKQPPADPRTISFDRSCFVRAGDRRYWTVFNAAGLVDGTRGGGGAHRYATREAAEDRAARIRGYVKEHAEPVWRRVSWTRQNPARPWRRGKRRNPDPVTPAIATRYASVLRLLAGATTPGEREAADAARRRMEDRYLDIRRSVPPAPPVTLQSSPPSPPPRPPPAPWGRTIRLECTEGRSSKFWEYVEMDDGMTARIRWGRIGSEGRSQIVAIKVAEDRLWEKLRHGYRRV